jgi:hypothetical protein
MKIYVSSYALASPSVPWKKEEEAALLYGLARRNLAGLELPFTGRLHAQDDSWLIDQFHPDWRFIVTLLPGTMLNLQKDQFFGLASENDDGRKRALEFAENARRTIEHLHSYLGYNAVSAVEIHSAPGRQLEDRQKQTDALTRSLSDLRRRHWCGAQLLLEHCDAILPDSPYEKGFLSLTDECDAIQNSSGQTQISLLVNWGRSAIETRSADGPLQHISAAREKNLLGGLFFSGATADDLEYGIWKDRHAPFSHSCANSLLTPQAARSALTTAGDIRYIGIKIQPLPTTLPTDQRLAMIDDALGIIQGCTQPPAE